MAAAIESPSGCTVCTVFTSSSSDIDRNITATGTFHTTTFPGNSLVMGELID